MNQRLSLLLLVAFVSAGVFIFGLAAQRWRWVILALAGFLALVAVTFSAFGPASALVLGLVGGITLALFAWSYFQRESGRSALRAWRAESEDPLRCERCGQAAPRDRGARSLSQVIWGGWTCPYCGAELDSDGYEKIR